MISVANNFLINEGMFDWMKTSLARKKPVHIPTRTQTMSDNRIETSNDIQKRLTPRPRHGELGFKSPRIYKHPKNLP